MTLTARSVQRFTRTERRVYQAAVQLAAEHPTGIDAPMLAGSLACDEERAAAWLQWLRATGDFGPADEQPAA
ncbi:MAG: hypothetical protein IT204_10320 [Fimbriimonadaceae bacterium]|nr:hypothetical protein [Fimbriimonadaceae bacterium]